MNAEQQGVLRGVPRPLTLMIPGTIALLAFALSSPAARASTEPEKAKAGGYAGTSECADCHEDQVAKLMETQHGKAAFAKLSSHSCETCHGPLAGHVASPKDKKHQPTLSKLTAQEKAGMCTACHDGGKQQMWTGSKHETRGLACQDCHSIHEFQSMSAQLKQPTAMETCFECHKEVRAESQKTSHHPVREGKIGCNDCHNPHGTATDKMITAASVNDQCYECHTEKRGPFVWEHAPVRENCLNCHAPHGSNHQKLQRTSVPYLCQQCHSNTRHPGTLYDAATLPGAARASNREFNRSCVNCHAAIHGTNHPSGPYLGR